MAVVYDNDLEEMTLTCDSCGYSETFDGSWGHCIEQAKMAGWKIRKLKSGDWEHFCNTCVELGEDL